MKRRSRKKTRKAEAGLPGLVFPWRSPRGAGVRTVVAILAAAGIFSGAAAILRMENKPEALRFAEGTGLIIVGPGQKGFQELLEVADAVSPFPDRWEPGQSGVLTREVGRLGEMLEQSGVYHPRLRPHIAGEPSPSLPGLLGTEVPPLPPPDAAPAVRPNPEAATEVFIELIPHEAPATRWEGEQESWATDDALNLVGRRGRFLLGIEPDGTVAACVGIDHGGMAADVRASVSAWLRQRRLAPATGNRDTEWVVAEIAFRAGAPQNDGKK